MKDKLFCSECGSEVNPNDLVCHNCGLVYQEDGDFGSNIITFETNHIQNGDSNFNEENSYSDRTRSVNLVKPIDSFKVRRSQHSKKTRNNELSKAFKIEKKIEYNHEDRKFQNIRSEIKSISFQLKIPNHISDNAFNIYLSILRKDNKFFSRHYILELLPIVSIYISCRQNNFPIKIDDLLDFVNSTIFKDSYIYLWKENKKPVKRDKDTKHEGFYLYKDDKTKKITKGIPIDDLIRKKVEDKKFTKTDFHKVLQIILQSLNIHIQDIDISKDILNVLIDKYPLLPNQFIKWTNFVKVVDKHILSGGKTKKSWMVALFYYLFNKDFKIVKREISNLSGLSFPAIQNKLKRIENLFEKKKETQDKNRDTDKKKQEVRDLVKRYRNFKSIKDTVSHFEDF